MILDRKWVSGRIIEPSILNNYTAGAPTINWSAVGSVSVGDARSFAARIIEVCDKLEDRNNGN